MCIAVFSTAHISTATFAYTVCIIIVKFWGNSLRPCWFVSHKKMPPPSILPELQGKLSESHETQFQLFKEVRTHLLPLTNIAINKSGSWYVRACRYSLSQLVIHSVTSILSRQTSNHCAMAQCTLTQYVCVSVCLSVCLSVSLQVAMTGHAKYGEEKVGKSY